MSKKKDPAFLFYSKDWIEGTAELMPDEKGVFIDLLAHQHQKGSIPSDERRIARMVGLDLETFKKIWATLSKKFETDGDRMVNRTLTERMTERSTNSQKNKVIGTFAAVLRSQAYPKKDVDFLKKLFKVDDFLPISTESVTDMVTEWCTERLTERSAPSQPPLGNENANEKKELSTNKRIEIFKKKVRDAAKGKFPDSMVDGFLNYWCQQTNGGKTFLAEQTEKNKAFEIPLRLATWKSKDTSKTTSKKVESSFEHQ